MLQQWLADPATDYLRTPGMMTQPKERQYSANTKRVIATTSKTYIVVQDVAGIETIIGTVIKRGKRQFQNSNTGKMYRSLTEAANSITLSQTVKTVHKTATGLVVKE